ncbi:MAG: hypothetical protein ABI743_10725, partial [bacterium]
LPALPYTSASRLDLHAYDVMGVILNDANGTPINFGNGDTVAPTILTNAEGYTDLWDAATEPYYPTPSVTDHPYRVFFEDPTPGTFDGTSLNGWIDPTAPSGQNVMPQGSAKSTVRYTFQIPSDTNQLHLGLAIGLSWGQPAQGRGANPGQRQNPVYYLPEFHHKAPWTLTADVISNTLQAGDPSSYAELEIRMRDWQMGATVAAPFDFGSTPRDQVAGASELESLTVYAPGVCATPLIVPVGNGSGGGVYDDRTFIARLDNTGDATEGYYWIWVKAVDSRVPNPAGVIDRNINFIPVGDFHTGYLTIVHVDNNLPNLPPVASLSPDPLFIECTDGLVTLDASGSADPEGLPLTFEVDYDLVDGDPANFTVDEGPTSSAVFTHQYFTPPTETHAAVRVTDPSGQSTIAVAPVIFAPIQLDPPVIINGWTPDQIQLFNGNLESASANLVTGNGYVFLGCEAHNSNGAAAGASSKMRFWRTQDGIAWEPLSQLDTTNPYQEIWWDYAIGIDVNGNLMAAYDVQDGPDYNGEFNHTLAVCPNNGLGTWTHTNDDSTVYGQPGSHFIYADPVDPNLVIDYLKYNNGLRIWRSTTGVAGPWTISAPFGGNPNDGRILRKPSGDLVIPYIDWDKTIRTQLSTDQGGSWTEVGSLALDNSQVWIGGCPAMNPTDPTGNTMSFVYKLYQSPGLTGEAGIHCANTIDGGVTWNIVNTNVSTNIEYEPGDPALIRIAYDANGGLYAAYFQALWPPGDCRGFVAYSGDDGATFDPDFQVYDTNPTPSWPGMQITAMPDGCGMITAFSEFQVIQSRTM